MVFLWSLWNCGEWGITAGQGLFLGKRWGPLVLWKPVETCGRRSEQYPGLFLAFGRLMPCPPGPERAVQRRVPAQAHHRHHFGGSGSLGEPRFSAVGQVSIERRAPALSEQLVHLAPGLIDQPGRGCTLGGVGFDGHPCRSCVHQLRGQSGQALSDRRRLPGHRGVLWWRRRQRPFGRQPFDRLIVGVSGHGARVTAAPDSH